MSTFSSLLSSLQNGKTGQRNGDSQIQTPPAPKPASTNLKRKANDEESSARKAPRLDDSKISQPVKAQTTTSVPARFQLTKPGVKAASNNPNAVAKAVGAVKSSNEVRQSSAPPTARPAAPRSKGGFTELMAKAKAAQEAIKAKGPDTIKHKPTEKLSKRDKARQAQAAKDQQGQQKPGQTTNAGLSSINSPRTNGAQPTRKAPLAYKGTMGKTATTNNASRTKGKSLAQDKYGGYASWSDLDEAEDEEQYDSESDMEEAGFDDMLAEEEQSSRIARREDQEALDEENRLRREKEARKKRLMALSNVAATKKRY